MLSTAFNYQFSDTYQIDPIFYNVAIVPDDKGYF